MNAEIKHVISKSETCLVFKVIYFTASSDCIAKLSVTVNLYKCQNSQIPGCSIAECFFINILPILKTFAYCIDKIDVVIYNFRQ